MLKSKEPHILSIQEAMDNLSVIVKIDLENPPLLAIIQQNRFVTNPKEMDSSEPGWLSGEGADPVLDVLDRTFHALHHHLMGLLESPEVDWNDRKVRQGAQAMVGLAVEAADKMNHYLSYRLEKPLVPKIEERRSFQELSFFYHDRLLKKMKGSDESWSEDWKENPEAVLLDLSKTGLHDFEAVRRDRSYELFSISNDEGEPYFNEALIRNIRLACFDVDIEASFEDDPLLRIRSVEDRDLQASARQILSACQAPIEDFYKLAKKTTDSGLAQQLNTALTALFLSSNPRNLIQNTSGKSSLQYFHDFQIFLRQAINSTEYQKFVAYPPTKEEKVPQALLQLTHALCLALFDRLGGVRQEAIGLLHRCMRKGEEKSPKSALKGKTIWNQLSLDDEKFRSFLSQFPNGPLFKIIDLIREKEPDLRAFDPFLQDNLPQRVASITLRGAPIQIFRMASPTRQAIISKVTIVEEFRGFLRSYVHPHKTHLLINLQDRTSWQEYARAHSLERLQKNAEFSGQIVVVTLPKDTEFYHQNGAYANLSNASEFLSQFEAQLAVPEECGFFFPAQLIDPLQSFIPAALLLIHTRFFQANASLTRRNREDFIEIFYQLFILKLIDLIQPNSLSFTCKDGVDIGAASLAAFFGFISLLTGDLSKELDFLRYLLYAPAFFVRERAIDAERFNRAISALECFSEHVSKEIFELYHPKLEKTLKIEHT